MQSRLGFGLETVYRNLGRAASTIRGRPAPQYILNVKATPNNTIVSLTDLAGNAVAVATGGLVGFKKAKRNTFEAGYQATTHVLDKLLARKLEVGQSRERFISASPLWMKVRGFGQGREASWRAVQASGWSVAVIQDTTRIPHGGCRPKKQRRL